MPTNNSFPGYRLLPKTLLIAKRSDGAEIFAIAVCDMGAIIKVVTDGENEEEILLNSFLNHTYPDSLTWDEKNLEILETNLPK
jgi:hypothetical protein